MRILIFGASGMLGHMLLRVLDRDLRYEVAGAIRAAQTDYPQLEPYCGQLIEKVDITDQDRVVQLLRSERPQVIINCAAVRSIRAGPAATADFVFANALWPHLLAIEAENIGARLCHISSDGVFSGNRGQYNEDDRPDPCDLYGAAKLLGEPLGRNCVNLRTSIIGPEVGDGTGLLSWFLGQTDSVIGYSRWLYSGLTTLELSRVIANHVLPNPDLSGLYHVGARPISKQALLELIAHIYSHSIDIVGDDSVVKDRTLNSSRFTVATAYQPLDWDEMLRNLRDFR